MESLGRGQRQHRGGRRSRSCGEGAGPRRWKAAPPPLPHRGPGRPSTSLFLVFVLSAWWTQQEQAECQPSSGLQGRQRRWRGRGWASGGGVGGRMGTGTWVGSLTGAGREARWLGAYPWPRGQIFLLSAGGCTSLAGGLEACGALELGSKGGGAGWWWGRGGKHEPEGSDLSFPHAHSHTHATHTPHAHRHAASASAPAVLISPRRGGRACASHRGAASSAVLIAGPPCFPGDLSMGPGRGCRAAQSSLGLAFVSRQAGGRLQLGRGPALAGQAVGPLGGVGTARGQCVHLRGLCAPRAARQGCDGRSGCSPQDLLRGPRINSWR